MQLVTAMRSDGSKFIVSRKDIGGQKSSLVEMRDRRGRLLGNKIAIREIIACYWGPIHTDAWPSEANT